MENTESKNKTKEPKDVSTDGKHSGSPSEYIPIFGDLFKFIKESTALFMTISYLTLIMSSTAYLYIKFKAFDINILQFITLEDILVTPIKNTDIILVYLAIICLFYLTDLSNRYSFQKKKEYIGRKTPWYLKLFHYINWPPQTRKYNIRVTIGTALLSLYAYISLVATLDAEDIKEGEGEHIRITLSDSPAKEFVLLGTSSYFLFAYDHENDKSVIFGLEAVEVIERIVTKPPESELVEQANGDS